MPKYDYVAARSVDEAVSLLNEPSLRSIPLAGGTDIFVALRVNPLWFDRLVDVAGVPEMREIREADGLVSLGAAVTFTRAAESPLLRKLVPFLCDACETIGGPAIRNTGTIGGNVANAAACADSLPALVCLEAVAHLRSPQGERQMHVEELITSTHETQILPGELLTHFTFKVPLPGSRGCFIKIGRRRAQSISRMSIAVLGHLDRDGLIDDARICPGSVVATPSRFTSVERMLVGQKPGPELVSTAADMLVEEMIKVTGRRWSTPYKEVALRGIAERSLSSIFLQEGASHAH